MGIWLIIYVGIKVENLQHMLYMKQQLNHFSGIYLSGCLAINNIVRIMDVVYVTSVIIL